MIELAYTTPTVTVQRDPVTVSLHAFKVEEVAEYLRQQGYEVDGTFSTELLDAARNQSVRRRIGGDDDDPDYVDDLLIEDDQLARIKTLILCGQTDSAREFLCQIVSEHIGRAL